MLNFTAPFYRRNNSLLAKEYKVIHYLIQKNACSTMKAQFVEILQMPKGKNFPKDVHNNDFYQFPRADRTEHHTKYKDFLRFTIVRNPWERLLSCYKDKIEGRPNDSNFFHKCSPLFYGGMSFAEFVEVVCTVQDIHADYHFCGQIYLMTDASGEFCSNYFCNLENLPNHLEEIKSLTGIPFEIPTRLNSTKKSTAAAYYTPELIEKIRIRFRRDIEYFGYEYGKKNDKFPFGYFNNEDTPSLSKWKIELLIEKNQQLLEDTRKSKLIIDALKKEAEPFNSEKSEAIRALKSSLSWKITSPLRALASFLNRKK